MWEAMENQQELTLACPARVKAIRQDSTACTVEIDQGQETAEVSTPLVVVADGGRSATRR